MIKLLKSNKMLKFLLIIICIFFLFNPLILSKSCLNAISVWTFKIFPVMFPFFILTRIIVNTSEGKQNFMDKFMKKIYHTPYKSFSTFCLSAIAGYPMGAKLISTMYENNQIDEKSAQKMFSFCSVSGPMFMVGTVGVSILLSFKAGIIILVSNLIGALINGIIYRGEKLSIKSVAHNSIIKKENILTDAVYDSIISILMVAGFIILSYIIIDLLKTLHVFGFISFGICRVFNGCVNQNVVESILCGFFEITRGIIDLNATNISLKLKSIIASGIIGFGGISVLIQSIGFLSKIKMPVKKMFVQKITQSITSLIICFLLCLFI